MAILGGVTQLLYLNEDIIVLFSDMPVSYQSVGDTMVLPTSKPMPPIRNDLVTFWFSKNCFGDNQGTRFRIEPGRRQQSFPKQKTILRSEFHDQDRIVSAVGHFGFISVLFHDFNKYET
jgi:hypothetical protein